ncbi:MAG TPA: class F sortase, partial [Solirubrobacteraceae bacterium]|nr:class F sortase [Solirubrobacteraceae bacterium]
PPPGPIGLALAAGVLAYAAIDRRLAATLTEGIDMPQTPAAPAMAPDESPQDRSHRGARRDRWISVGVVIAMAVATADTSLFAADAAQGARDRVAIGEIPPPGATAGGVALDPGPPPGATAGGVALDPGPPPVSIALPAIRVESELEDLRLAADGTLTVPRDAARAGWWSQGVAPGDPGPAVIVGHVDSYDGPGIFLLLHRLQPGDEAVVRRNDGTSVTFVVDAVHQFHKDAFPTDIVYGPTPEPTLRLITCGGSFDKRTRSYDDNVIVFAHLKAPDAA